MKALEVTGTINEQGHLQLDQPLVSEKSSRVRAIVLLSDADINDAEWRTIAANNPAFAFLHDPEEDIYTLEDGKPLDDER